ncbi:MAG: DEAD/DEAH box helicase [Opitutales bacterium]
MALYVPTENFASQYPEWGRWHWLNFKKLPGPSDHKQAGALLFVEGKVSDLEALDDRAGFTAGVSDGRVYGVSAWLTEDGDENPRFECGCPKGRDESPCPHALALLAALVYLFHEHNFIPLAPLQDNVNALAKQIDRSSTKRQSKNLKRLRLRNLSPGPPYLEGDIPLPDSLVQAINPYREMSRMARNTLELPVGQMLHERLRQLVDYVGASKIQLEAERPEGSFFQLKPELETVGTRLRFTALPAQDLVYFEPVLDEKDDKEIIAQIGDRVQIREPGRIALIDEDKFDAVPRALAAMERGFSTFARHGDSLPLETINNFICRLGNPERRLLRQCDFATLEQDELRTQVPETRPALQVKATLDISTDENQSGYHFATFHGNVADNFIDLSHVFGDFMRTLCTHAEAAERLLGSSARVGILLDASAQLPWIKKKSERRSYIESVVERHEFRKAGQAKAASRFLRQLERDYCRPKSAVAPLCLEDPDTGRHYWQTVKLPLPGLLALAARLYRHAPFQQFIGMELDHLPFRLNGAALHEISAACEAFGFHLEIDDARTVSRKAAIHVDCFDDQKEDWFELKPSIRCDGMTIPAEQWEPLLHGQLILQSDDGRRIAPQVEKPELLSYLIEATGQRTAGKGATRVHRLHLLDWLALRQEGLDLRLPPEIDALLHSLLEFDGIPRLSPPEDLKARMRPYQQSGFEWLAFLYQHRLGACLADDMGLGKTLQTLAFLAHLKADRSENQPLRALAVLPPSLLFNWENEATRFAPGLTLATYAGGDRDPAAFDQADLTLTTYDILRRDIEHFPERPFEVVVFDEAQALKNHASRRTRAARRLERRFTLCLTGTPMENHIGEYHAIMDLALPGLMGERKAFLQALKDGDESALRRAKPFLLRRTKSKILAELPAKVESDIALAMSETQREIYTRIVAEVRQEVQDAYQEQTRAQAGIVALAALTRLRQVCVSPALLGHDPGAASPKIEYLAETLEELRAEGHSVLVFSQFVKALDQIQGGLEKAGIRPLRLDGGTPTRQRKTAVERFQNSDRAEVFLVSLKAGGVGLNLTRASYVIHVDPWWNPSVENQASDRAHRIGQKQTVFVQRLLMQDSVEEKIMALKARKKRLFDAIVGEAEAGGGQGAPSLKKEDFEFLIGG